MKKHWIGALLVLLYCVPWVFFALWGDAKMGTMLLYGVLLAAHAVLCLIALKTQRAWAAVAGSALSGVMSLLFVKFSALNEMNYFFKPFTAVQLAALVSFVLFAAQACVTVWWRKKNRGKTKKVG